MSLKYFHIVFVTISTLLAIGCAALEYNYYRAFGGAHLFGAILCAIAALALIVYGFWFWKKAKRLIL